MVILFFNYKSMSSITIQDIPNNILSGNKSISLKNDFYEVVYLFGEIVIKQADKNSILLSPKSFDFWNNKEDEIYDRL